MKGMRDWAMWESGVEHLAVRRASANVLGWGEEAYLSCSWASKEPPVAGQGESRRTFSWRGDYLDHVGPCRPR